MDRMTMDNDEDEAPAPRRPNLFNIDDTNMASQDILLTEFRRSAKDGQQSGPITDAVPISLDEGVETIGEAFVEGEMNEITKDKLATMPRRKQQQLQQQQQQPRPEKIAGDGDGRKASVSIAKEDYDQLQQKLKLKELELGKARTDIENAKELRWAPPSIDDTINRLLIGQVCCLEWFKSLEEKEALLHAAAQTSDGNCILTVLIYLRRTVSVEVLLRLITKDPVNLPVLLNHYCVHLKHLKALADVQSVYRWLGQNKTCASFEIKRIEAIPSIQEKNRELQLLVASKVLGSDSLYIEEYIKLIEVQRKVQEQDQNVISESKKLPCQPLYTTLLYLCQWHGQEREDRIASPVRLKTDFNVSDKVLFQMRLVAECKRRDWVKFEQLLTTKGFFGSKLKSVIGFERVVRILGLYGAPQEVIHPYLMEIEDHEARLDLAMHFKCHNTAIETLKLMRDRQGMEEYINHIEVWEQEKYRDKIQALLANTQIKWK